MDIEYSGTDDVLPRRGRLDKVARRRRTVVAIKKIEERTHG